MIHLFAFALAVRGLPPDVESVEVGGVTAVFGRDVGDGREEVVRHGLVGETLLDAADAVLPARFGERFPSVESLEVAVAARAGELSARLAAVAGCVEVSVHVARARRAETATATGGGDYMRERLRAVGEDEAALAELRSLLERHARATSTRKPPRGPMLHEAGYLVERSAVEPFAAVVEAYAAAHAELTVVCTGPWAPASFAEAA